MARDDRIDSYLEMLAERADPSVPHPPLEAWTPPRSPHVLTAEDRALAAEELETRAQQLLDEVVLVCPAHRAAWCRERSRELLRIAELLRR